VTVGRKPATTTFKDMNRLTDVAPSRTAGPQRITITNPDGEAMALDAAYTAN